MNEANERPKRPPDEVVFVKDGFTCVYCGFDGSTFENWRFLQVDHFVPRSRGGSDLLENLRTACIICNSMKGGQAFDRIEDAQTAIRSYYDQMLAYWKQHVEPLLTKTT